MVNQRIAQMQNLSREEEFQFITFMKMLVPDFKSNHSRFERIDQKPFQKTQIKPRFVF